MNLFLVIVFYTRIKCGCVMLYKGLKYLGVSLLFLLLAIFSLGWYLHEPKPEGHSPALADELAQKMLEAVHYEAWDSLPYIHWKAITGMEYIWMKAQNTVQVNFNDGTKVLLETTTQKGKVFQQVNQLTGKEADSYLQKAWQMFCNDSFWLNPLVKAFDPGTKRTMVQLADGRQGLMVSYHSGGVTPGDSYVWILNEQNLPISCKMWVSIIPIGGVEFSWENWVSLPGGAKISKDHTVYGRLLQTISYVKAGFNYEELAIPEAEAIAHY